MNNPMPAYYKHLTSKYNAGAIELDKYAQYADKLLQWQYVSELNEFHREKGVSKNFEWEETE